MGIVLLKHRSRFVAQVPLLNFHTFVPEKVKDLVQVSESDTRRWKFYTYDIRFFASKTSVERWASWLTHWNLRAVIDGGPRTGDVILFALGSAELIGGVDYQDALLDAWLSWLQDGEPAGSLNVDRLQDQGHVRCLARLDDLRCVLVLHHDASAVVVENGGDPDEYFPYHEQICIAVRNLALDHFSRTGGTPKDSLQLSDEEFCKQYHSHHENRLPCYKTKKLPEQSQV
jgi:hypothetical protein